MKRPNTFVWETLCISLSPNLNTFGMMVRSLSAQLKQITSVLSLSQFILSLHFLDQSLRDLRTWLRLFTQVVESGADTLMVPSSANFNNCMLGSCVRSDTKSDTKILNKTGEITEPCGNPYSRVLRVFPKWPFILSFISLVLRKLSIRWVMFLEFLCGVI